jgi:hypothetical protein
MHYSGKRASLRRSLRPLLLFVLTCLVGGSALGAAVSLTSPEASVYVGNQLKSFQVDADGVVSTTEDRELTLNTTQGKSFKLSGQVWLGGPSSTSTRAPSDYADGFALVIRQLNGTHRYELTSHGILVKRLKVNGTLDDKIDQLVNLQTPTLNEWTPFSAEVTPDQITFMFGGQHAVIPGPVDTAGTNYISLSAGSKLRYLQLELLAGSGAPGSIVRPVAPSVPIVITSPVVKNPPPARRSPPATIQDFLKAMVIIKGDLGNGSGFIVKKNDQFCVVTNQHVLSGNSNFTVTGVDGTKYPTTGALFGAVGYDVAMLRIPDAKNFIPVDDYSAASAAIDDPVVVLGNAQGGGVVTRINGKLLGVGPELVEVNAKFVQGNSGSPIIDNTTHKVVGIATYASNTYTPSELQRAANTPPLRWFGYRLDTIKEWQELDRKRFEDEGDHLALVAQRTNSLIQVYQLLRARSPGQAHLADSNIDVAYATYVRDAKKAIAANSPGDTQTALKKLLSDLIIYLDNDTSILASQDLYSYHADQLKAQIQIREVIRQGLQEIMTRMQGMN